MEVLTSGQRQQPLHQPDGRSGTGPSDNPPDRTHRGKSQQAQATAGVTQQMPSGTGGPYGMVHAPPPAFWPESQPTYGKSLHQLIINQVHYYFSPENLYRDDFLRGQMDPTEGWLSLQLLATFNRLRSLSADVNVIAEVTAPAYALAWMACPASWCLRAPCPLSRGTSSG